MLEALTIETFQALTGTDFRLRVDETRELRLTLDSVTPLGDQGVGGRRRAFSLVFRGAQGPSLPQRIYELHHEKLGTLGIFMVPIAPDAQGTRYEAIFT